MKVIPDNSFESIQNVVAERVDDDPPGQLFRGRRPEAEHHAVRLLGHHLNMSVMTKEELNTMMACLSLGCVSHVKRFFKGTYHHFCTTYVQNYLDEFCYGWNRRHIKRNKAQHLLTACIATSRSSCQRLLTSAPSQQLPLSPQNDTHTNFPRIAFILRGSFCCLLTSEIDFTDPAKSRPCLRYVGRYVLKILTICLSISVFGLFAGRMSKD